MFVTKQKSFSKLACFSRVKPFALGKRSLLNRQFFLMLYTALHVTKTKVLSLSQPLHLHQNELCQKNFFTTLKKWQSYSAQRKRLFMLGYTVHGEGSTRSRFLCRDWARGTCGYVRRSSGTSIVALPLQPKRAEPSQRALRCLPSMVSA